MIYKNLPAKMGYKMPAEWEKHKFTLMVWPVREALWPGNYKDIIVAYSDLVNIISSYEPVVLIVKRELKSEAKKYCSKNVSYIEMENDDSWIRDNGPTVLRNFDNEIAAVKWNFNAWGGKYPFKKDELIGENFLQLYNIPYFKPGIIMEGGAFHTDGEGTLITTRECLLNERRNSFLNKNDIEKYLRDFLGIKKVIWLNKGLYKDDTDGHIDNVACFARPGVIIIQKCNDKSDNDYDIYKENLRILMNERDSRGRKFEIIDIIKPKNKYYENTKLTLSYINFYFVNGGLILPVFGEDNRENDNKAFNIIKSIFNGRKISTVDGLTLARGGGNVHCLTQQFPVGRYMNFE